MLRRKDASGDDQELVNSNTITLILLLDIPGGEYENEKRKEDGHNFQCCLVAKLAHFV